MSRERRQEARLSPSSKDYADGGLQAKTTLKTSLKKNSKRTKPAVQVHHGYDSYLARIDDVTDGLDVTLLQEQIKQSVDKTQREASATKRERT